MPVLFMTGFTGLTGLKNQQQEPLRNRQSIGERLPDIPALPLQPYLFYGIFQFNPFAVILPTLFLTGFTRLTGLKTNEKTLSQSKTHTLIPFWAF